MYIEEKIVTMDKKEIKALNKDNVKFDASLVSHITRIERVEKALAAEIKQYKEIAKVSDIANNKLVTVENRPSAKFDKDRFIADFGQDVYDKYCSMHDAWYVTFG